MANKIVVVHLYGGIGNQLFQYTFGEYVRNRYHLDVYYDISSFGVIESFRELQIDSIVKNLPVYHTTRFFFPRYVGCLRRLLRLSFSMTPGNRYFYNEIDESVFQNRDWNFMYLDGYWQNKIYPQWVYSNVGNIYKSIDTIPDCIKPYIEQASLKHVTAIHIRRGDYLDSQNRRTIYLCPIDYYVRAAECILDEFPETEFLVFSDDLAWAKDNLKIQAKCSFVKNEDIKPFWYIYIMSLCRNNIISNSSFSWWGAFLNRNPSKMVIAPSNWILNKEKPEVYFDEWIKL